jgi:hypothetical protein
MAKVKVSLRSAVIGIKRAEKKLRALRSRVSKAEKKKIDLELQVLKKANKMLLPHCFARIFFTGK